MYHYYIIASRTAILELAKRRHVDRNDEDQVKAKQDCERLEVDHKCMAVLEV